jgi:hypothetical protein
LDRQGRQWNGISCQMMVDVLITHDLVDQQGRQRCFDSPIRLGSPQLARQRGQQYRASCQMLCTLLSSHGSLLEEDIIDSIVIAWLTVLSLMAPLLLA